MGIAAGGVTDGPAIAEGEGVELDVALERNGDHRALDTVITQEERGVDRRRGSQQSEG